MLNAVLESNRIVITGDTFANQSFLRGLPDARWNPGAKAWTCLATPFTAARLAIAQRCPGTLNLATLARVPADEESVAAGSKLPSWRHQRLALGFAGQLTSPMLGMAMGTGKSKVALDWLSLGGTTGRRVLILCPHSVVNVWPNQFATHREERWTVLALNRGTVPKKIEAASRALAAARPADNVAVVVNYESARTPKMSKELLQHWWTEVILDESHRAKSPASDTAKICFKAGQVAERRMCLTGTPMPHSPLDIFAQYKFLDAGVFGTSYREFRDHYAVPDRMFPSRVLGYRNTEEFEERCKLLMFRCGQDVLDLPEITHNVRTCELPPRARRLYDELDEELCAAVGDDTITVPNALVKLLRLQQITSGYVIDDDEREIPLHDGKEKLLQDLLEDVSEPVVVFVRFRRDLDAVQRVCDRVGLRYGELSGRSKGGLTEIATMAGDVDVLGCQMQSGGVGVDLTRACVVVYYSVGYSLGDYEQSMARAHRPGQTRPVRVFHLTASRTVDQEVYAALRSKRDVVEAILSRMRGAKGELVT